MAFVFGMGKMGPSKVVWTQIGQEILSIEGPCSASYSLLEHLQSHGAQIINPQWKLHQQKQSIE